MPNNSNDNRTILSTEKQYNQFASSRQLDNGQKIALVVLAFLAVFVVVAWVVQTKQSLSGGNYINNNSSTCNGDDCLANDSSLDIRTKDTDHDGLSDYDELNIYNTSPYLEDSDSDGYTDKQEIDNQKDPNCPFGQNCYVEPIKPTNEENILFPGQPTTVPKQSTNITGQIDSAQQVLNGQGDAQSLRSLLLNSGMDKQVLDQISDQELMATYQDILAK